MPTWACRGAEPAKIEFQQASRSSSDASDSSAPESDIAGALASSLALASSGSDSSAHRRRSAAVSLGVPPAWQDRASVLAVPEWVPPCGAAAGAPAPASHAGARWPHHPTHAGHRRAPGTPLTSAGPGRDDAPSRPGPFSGGFGYGGGGGWAPGRPRGGPPRAAGATPFTPVVPKDPAAAAAIAINKRITAAFGAQDILDIVARVSTTVHGERAAGYGHACW